MKEIVIFGSCKTLEHGLKDAMSDEFQLIALQNNAKEYFKNNRPVAAVICMRRLSDLDVAKGVSVPFVVLSESAEEEFIDRAVALGAKYFFVEPVATSVFTSRLACLANSARAS